MAVVYKIAISCFLMAFTVFNTGLPVALHLCHTMDRIDFELCDMCKHTETPGGDSLKSNHTCCSSRILAQASEAKFIGNSNKHVLVLDVIVLWATTSTYKIQTYFNLKQILNDASPPPYSGKAILKMFSVFLI